MARMSSPPAHALEKSDRARQHYLANLAALYRRDPELAELTQQGCDKRLGGSDGFTFMGQAIVCRST